MAELFTEEPRQWGLRGDPVLWRDLKKQFETVEIPASEEELRQLLEEAFETATGRSVHCGEILVLDRFKSHGMTSGGISTKFWSRKAIPLLIGRFHKLL